VTVQKRINDLEFRYSDFNKSYEIVQWVERAAPKDEHCFVLCFYNRGSEGYNIEFVGDRPFDLEDQSAFWSLLRFGQKVLDATFELEEAAK
jgi:hypothetical protein